MPPRPRAMSRLLAEMAALLVVPSLAFNVPATWPRLETRPRPRPSASPSVRGPRLPCHPLCVANGSGMGDATSPEKAPPSVSALKSRSMAVTGFLQDRAPGLAVAGTIGFAGELIASNMQKIVALSPLLYATAIGIVVGNIMRIWDPELKRLSPAAEGMVFAKKRLLRAGIILYGAKITFAKIMGIGWAGLLTDLYVVSSTLALGFGLGRLLGLSPPLTTLISTGSAICGCSAVAATQPIINAEAHEVAAAIGVVVLCGTAAMFLYPALFQIVPALSADARLMGIYTGSTVHELAGVVAAGNSMGAEVASTSVITKLLRVFLLEPWIIALYYLGIGQGRRSMGTETVSKAGNSACVCGVSGACERGCVSQSVCMCACASACVSARERPPPKAATDTQAGKGVPWFAFGFIAVATFNSIWGIAPQVNMYVYACMHACCMQASMHACMHAWCRDHVRIMKRLPSIMLMPKLTAPTNVPAPCQHCLDDTPGRTLRSRSSLRR